MMTLSTHPTLQWKGLMGVYTMWFDSFTKQDKSKLHKAITVIQERGLASVSTCTGRSFRERATKNLCRHPEHKLLRLLPSGPCKKTPFVTTTILNVFIESKRGLMLNSFFVSTSLEKMILMLCTTANQVKKTL